MVGTSLLLTMLHIPSSEASEAFKLLSPSPLLTVESDVYFTLLTELTEEIGSYHSYSRQQLLQLCRILGESTISSEQTGVDPYAIDPEVLLFHTLFFHWPERLKNTGSGIERQRIFKTLWHPFNIFEACEPLFSCLGIGFDGEIVNGYKKWREPCSSRAPCAPEA